MVVDGRYPSILKYDFFQKKPKFSIFCKMSEDMRDESLLNQSLVEDDRDHKTVCHTQPEMANIVEIKNKPRMLKLR